MSPSFPKTRLLLLPTLLAASAAAQDPSSGQKEPNVLLIVDSSGSMEYLAGSDTFPSCDPSGGTPSDRSRWVDLVEVLGGTIDNYRCQELDRKSPSFKSTYSLPGSVLPGDANYRNPYHRPLSSSCAPGPNTAGISALTNAFTYVDPLFSDYAAGTSCSFAQGSDGLIDSLGTLARFGLMTFDTLPDQGRGYATSSPYGTLWTDGVSGAFSYYMDGGYAQGAPQLCPTNAALEVGVRNGAAPAWEGRLVHFGDPNAPTSYNTTRHTRIERTLLSTRPYGATPIAGALTDARDFLLEDDLEDPTAAADAMAYTATSGTTLFGPQGDEYVQGGCRDQYVILLTDGEPNLDLRPHCEGPDPSKCPYDEPALVAADLKAKGVPTYVVGLMPDTTSGGVDCTTLVSGTTGSGPCVNPTDDEVKACCVLTEIAYSGGTNQAYFASDKKELRNQLSDVFKQFLVQSGSATRPVRSPGVGASDNSGAKAYRLLTSYENTGDGLWRGNIERLRWTCEGNSGAQVATEQPKDPAKGDDFSFTVNKAPTDRTFQTYVPEAVTIGGVDKVYTNVSVRPNVGSAIDDGVSPQNSGAALSGNPSSFAAGLAPEALMPDLTSGACSGLTLAACRDLLAPWYVGLDNGSGEHRCPSPASSPTDFDCSVVGDVMHSTPVIVDRPAGAVEDETYVTFATSSSAATRPMMAYTSSNDGVLHGFMLSPNQDSDRLANPADRNETFAFVPPAILPTIQSQYPSSRYKLLDGTSVVQDVVATVDGTNTYYGYALERASTAFSTNTTTWRTIFVQSFGGSTAGFYALDITEPANPTFLWQLTTDQDGNPLFGEQAATPVITTLNIGGHEVAVAVLPGGYGSPASGSCDRAGSYTSGFPTGYTPRSQVQCYNLDTDNDGTADNITYVGARSLTVVRLDSGEVIRSFRRDETDSALLAGASGGYSGSSTGLIKESLLDSPITGTPVVYPAGPGTVSDRLFVGDQDGGLWKVNFSSSDPENWSMELFFDAYAVYSGATPATAGQPVILAPVLSVDERGQLTVAFSTGDQDLSGGTGDENYLWSLRETVDADGGGFSTTVNWYLPFPDGKHVLGSMLMLGEVLYFATYDPQTSGACDTGESAIYGLHYTIPFDAADLSQGGRGGLSLDASNSSTAAGTTVTNQTATELGLPADDTLIFGVNLEYVPNCYDTSAPISTWLGTHQNVTNMTSSQLQLTFQTGTTETSKENLGFRTGFESVALAPPRSAATIEAWAPILE